MASTRKQHQPDIQNIPALRRTAFQLLNTKGAHTQLMWIILTGFTVFVVVLVFVPWQQSVVGSGIITSFAPDARPQTIESTISGRIVKWFVKEGAFVQKGDTLCVLSDINVNFFDQKLLARLETLRTKTYDAQEQAIAVAAQRRKQAEQRYTQAIARYENALVEVSTARIRLRRADTLFVQDLVSRRELETAQLNVQKAVADSINAAAGNMSALQDVDAFRADEERIVAQAYVVMQEADVRLANATGRVGAGTVVAPISGTVVRISKPGAGQTVKENEQLAIVVPRTSDQAVELYLSSMDAAIIEPGKLVSLQFSGFPAFQFSGWQSVNVGIFHGKVKVVDAVDDGSGRFRVLVIPDTDNSDFKDWPSSRFLRQGTEATGWVLLNEVPLGYELWRQLMGFPPQFPVQTNQKSKPKGANADASREKK
jgi:membrane fusion protein, adhesin transport system